MKFAFTTQAHLKKGSGDGGGSLTPPTAAERSEMPSALHAGGRGPVHEERLPKSHSPETHVGPRCMLAKPVCAFVGNNKTGLFSLNRAALRPDFF